MSPRSVRSVVAPPWRVGRSVAPACAIALAAAIPCTGCSSEPGGGPCEPVSCRTWCVSEGWGSGMCIDDWCTCLVDAGADAEADVPPEADAEADDGGACHAVECHRWCVSNGADYGECRGSECRCTPPVGADADDGGGDDDAAPGICAPGETLSRVCGERCGVETSVCGADGLWGPWGSCEGEGECAEGSSESRTCPCGGTETRTCTPSCAWGGWSGCAGGECTPGATETRDCACGSTRSTRTCTPSCTWSGWSACPVPSHLTSGTNDTPCSEAPETWQCIMDTRWGTWASQVCRGGVWVTYHLNPADCPGCCPSYSSACE